ncbi:MAG: hypothetical protein HW421_1230 [Ignavibacteria bacterium]|nr:hypothetical protein [Ignavibacteria bacterium]
MRKLFVLSIISALFFIFSGNSFGQQKFVKFKAQPSKSEVKEGEAFSIKLSMMLDKDYHTYSLDEQLNKEGIGPLQTEISLEPKEMVSLNGNIRAPKPKKERDEGFEMDVKFYEGNQVFEIPSKALKNINFVRDCVFVVTYLQLCTGTTCLPPEDFKTAISAEVYQPSETASISEATPQQVESMKKEEKPIEEKESIFDYIWISLTMGALALLMPCVYPMVPITISFFTNRAEKSKGKGLRDALVYAIGIIVTFTFIGVVFSLLFGKTGVQDFATNPYVYFFIGAICIFFGLNLFGMFEIQLPTGIMNKLNAKSQEGQGIFSVILMALTFSMASFSCVGPHVAAALGAAASGDWFAPTISMLAFSSVLAFPFFLLALFPAALNKMPRAGGWMNNIKGVMGFIIVAVSLKFFNDALITWGSGISRELFLSIWSGIGFLMVLYVLGIFKLMHDSPIDRIGIMRLFFAIIFAAMTFFFLSGLFGRNLGELETFIPQSEALAAASAQSPDDVWLTDYMEALKKAKAEGKSIFVDFTGVHCTNCKKMERTVFVKPEIKAMMNKMVKVKLITDVKEQPYLGNRSFQLDRFGTTELPLYAIISNNDKTIATEVYNADIEKFKSFLEKGGK